MAILIPGILLISSAVFSSHKIWVIPYATADFAAAYPPLTGLIFPESSSSPRTRHCSDIKFSVCERILVAMAKSIGFSFFKSAGEAEIRTLSWGNVSPEFANAALTLSLVSFTWESAIPIISTAGIPLRKSVSIFTIAPSYPNGENE